MADFGYLSLAAGRHDAEPPPGFFCPRQRRGDFDLVFGDLTLELLEFFDELGVDLDDLAPRLSHGSHVRFNHGETPPTIAP